MSLSRHFGLFMLAAAVTFSTAVFVAPTFISVLTSGTSGVCYPIGIGLSQTYGHDIQSARTSVQTTKASVKNLNLPQAGRGELALALGDSIADAWNGVTGASFRTPLKELRAIGNTYSNHIQVVASRTLGIKILADLRGKRTSVGAPKSSTELNTRAVSKATGLSYEDMGKVEYLLYAESVELTKNHQLDVTLQSSGSGVAAIRNLVSTMPITFVTIPTDVVARIDSSAYHITSIPAGTYDGQEQDAPTVVVGNILASYFGASDELTYQMTELMFDNLPRLVTVRAAIKDITLDKATKNLPIPLHSSAERSYKEKSILPE